jgi:preprotein translocase subunit SecD
LIFERIKDELRDKPKQERKKSIQIWFDNSWSAIWDSNITGLIIAIILFIFWVNMIKWFGLMLWIWIIVSLITAMWVSRVLILAIWKEKLSNSSFIWFNK